MYTYVCTLVAIIIIHSRMFYVINSYYVHTVNGESFAGLNFHGFDPMKYFTEILSWFIGQECSQL